MTRLADLGPRICILGPSNSGKSTLAVAIGAALGRPVIHLDLLHHLPNTDWVPRPTEEFHALHDEAILGDRWVMDGNYSKLFPQRFERATGVILLDVPTSTSLLRYFRRTLFEKDGRAGALEGCRDSVKWPMIHHVAMVTPKNRRRYAEIFKGVGLPKISLASARAIDRFYRAENLSRPQSGQSPRPA
jgi:adenylate kinase family enzyme